MPNDISSLYGGLQPPQKNSLTDLLDMATKAQTFTGRAALGDIYNQSIDPNTGDLDPQKLMQLAPKAGVYAPEVAAQALARKHEQIGVTEQSIRTQQAWWDAIAQRTGSLISDPDLTIDKIHGMTADLLTHEINPGWGPLGAVQFNKMFRDENGNSLPPEQLRKKLSQVRSAAIDTLHQSELFDTGKVGPDGKPLLTTRSGAIVYGSPTGRPLGSPVLPQQGNAAPAPSGAPAASPASGAPSAPQGTQAGAVLEEQPMGLPPGQKEAMSSERTAAQTGANALDQAANLGPQLHADLDRMYADVKGNERNFGPWVQQEKNANVLLGRLTGWYPTMKPEDVAKVESFEKLANQIALAQSQQGHMTDLGLQTAMGANPHAGLSALGIKGITALLHGNQDAVETKANEWHEFHDPGGSKYQPGNEQVTFNQWSRQFNRTFNPRVFHLERMDNDDREKLLGSMSKKDKQKLLNDISYAEQQGWIKPAQAQQ